MAANLYERSVTHSGKGSAWFVLADAALVMDATIIMSGENTGDVTVQFLGSETAEAAWPPGSVVQLRGVDLSQIRVNVPSEHRVLVIGQAP